MNPYAGEAVLELVVNSEAGNESNSRFESVIVPPRSSTIVDFNDLTPGRENLSVAIETVTGRVNAVGRQGDAGESAVWNAVPAASDWFLPVPKGLGERRLIIATPSNTDIEYQVDLYTPEGVEEVFVSGSLPARGQVVVDLGEVTGDAVGVRVVSTGPIVSTLWTNSAAGLSVTNGSPVEANRWFLPGAGTPDGGGATMVLFNTGIEDTEIVLRPLRVNTSTRVFNLMSESTLEIGLEQADGYLVESTGPITVLWTSQREGSGSASIGVPIIDE
jgi:hypothetical protein